jgi:hypothetical protein
MDENAARTVMAKLGIAVTHRSQKGWLNAQCPMAPWTHEKGTDKHPAFAISVNEEGPSFYKCLACHHKGRVSQLVRTLERYRGDNYGSLSFDCDVFDMSGAFGSGFETVSQMSTYEEPEPIDESLIRGVYPPAFDVPQAAKYLNARGISCGTAEVLELSWDPNEKRILFPVRGQAGELYGFTGRSVLEEKFYPYASYKKVRDYLGLPKRMLLLGANLYQRGKPSFVVEGLFGYASLIEIGARDHCNPLALMGSEMTSAKATALALLDENTYLLPDNDKAGDSCLWGDFNPKTGDHNGDGAVKRLKAKGSPVFIPEWPQGKADPDELILDDVLAMLGGCPIYMGPT